MKRLPIALCAALVATPAFAQQIPAVDHAGMDHMDGMGHAMPHAQAVPATPPSPPGPGNSSPPPFPAPTAAERAAVFPQALEGMDMSMHMDDNPLIAVLHGDRLEQQEAAGTRWDLRAGIGRNFDKLWLRNEGRRAEGRRAEGRRAEGRRAEGRTSQLMTELTWAHATGPWWDRTIGLRHDAGNGGPSRDWLSIGVQGLAPGKIELQATAYLGASGRIAARLESEYELRLAHRLILQPRLEANVYGRSDPANRIDKGLDDLEFGLRLRYEVSPRFAPYVGYAWSRRFGGKVGDVGFGDTANAHDNTRGWVAGVRFWL